MLKIAFRHILRQKFYAVLNLLGLAVGLGCCLLMMLYLVDEFSYDRFHEKADRIYRIDQTNIWVDNGVPFGSTGPAVIHALKAEIPELEAITRIHTPGSIWLSRLDEKGDKRTFDEENILAADSNVFDIFSFEMLKGNAETALRDPQSLVLTETAAKRYFGHTDVLGKQLLIRQNNEESNFTINGLVQDIPNASHFHFDVMLSMTSFPRIKRQENWTWIWTTFVTYALFEEGADMAKVKAKLNDIPPKYTEATLQNIMNITYDEYLKQGKVWELFLMPLKDIRLYSGDTSNRLGPTGDIQQITVLGIVALLILILSCINFMNLATARASRRAREIGVKKVLGAHRSSLIRQFLVESMLFSILATILGLALAELTIQPFNTLSAKALSLDPILHPWLIPALLGMSLFMGLLAGSYPAFYLTSFKPVHVLKGRIQQGMKGKGFRNVLVTFQFTISIGLIICTLFVYEQLRFTRDKDLGFEPDNLLVIQNVEQLETRQEVFKEAVLQLPFVDKAANSDLSPPRIYNQDYFKALDGAPDQEVPVSYMSVDADYLKTLGIELVAGRDFRKDQPAEAQRVIINEAAVKAMGWGIPNAEGYVPPLGKRLRYLGDNVEPFEVIGVLEDFHFWSLHEEIEPLAVFMHEAPIWTPGENYLSIRLDGGIQSASQLKEAIVDVENIWTEMAPGTPFAYSFLDQDFFDSFQAEQRLGRVMGIFTFLAIFIACLGLLGLTAFSVEQRKQEIGIRKVLGARPMQIVGMLSRSVITWILLAFVIATPLTIWLVNGWLETFAYRISMGPLAFVLAGGITLLVAMLTMSFHAWQATRINPVEALRDE